MNKLIKIKIIPNEYLSAAKIAKMFNVSEWSIYEGIRTDPTFPFHNVGPKKNYRINPTEYKRWLKTNTTRTKNRLTKFKSVDELLGAANE